MTEPDRSALLRRATLFAVALGALLRWPALSAGFMSDDYQQLAMLRGRFLLARPAWDLFWFGPRGPRELERLTDFGFDPWWTQPSHRLAMFRPLSSLLVWFDDRLFGRDALLYHLHSFAWWAALVIAVSLLLARLLPARVAALAVVLFALDEAHTTPLAWLANRSALVSATFGTLALLSHLRGRTAQADSGGARWLALSAVLFALALAAGEYGLAVLPYLFAFELLGARDGLRARLAGLAAPVAVAAAYLLLRGVLGYGTAGSGHYASLTEPGRYALAAFARVPVLAADLMLGLPATWFQTNTPWRNTLLELQLFTPAGFRALPDWRTLHVALGVVALGCAALLLRFAGRGLEDGPRRSLRWLACGALLSLPLAAAALPAPRLLIAPAIFASALFSAAIFAAWPRGRVSVTGVLLCAALLVVHGGFAAYHARSNSERIRRSSAATSKWAAQAELPRAPEGTDIVIVAGSDFATATNLPWIRLQQGLPLPRSYRQLSGAQQPHQLQRVDAHSLELSVVSNDVRDAFAGSIYRARDAALHPGQRVQLPRMEVTVLAARDGNPYRLRVRFERELDDPRLLFLQARPDGLRRLVLPPQGERLLLPRAFVPWAN